MSYSVYALVGYPLSHSFSQKYFNDKFKKRGIKASYVNIEIENIELLKSRIHAMGSISGFNITIPHKKNIIPLLFEKDSVVAKIDACNCVKIIDNQWYGYNTDVIGFKKSFLSNWKENTQDKALILGTGGASNAIAHVFEELNIDYNFVSTSRKQIHTMFYQDLTPELIAEHKIIVNTTPVGMYPKTSLSILQKHLYKYVNVAHIFYDLIYNPTETLFLQMAREKGAITSNGYNMLLIQAEESYKIWTSKEI